MSHEDLVPVPRAALKLHVRQALKRYWAADDRPLDRLEPVEHGFPTTVQSLSLVFVQMPDWATECAVDGCLAVPSEACGGSTAVHWSQVDWWLAVFLLLESWHERAWEARHGPIHSYSLRLTDWDERVWARAWVNRMALFLRSWAAHQCGQDASALFGPLPEAEIVMTHDVDAIEKTAAIRLKQSAFMAFNAARLAIRARPRMALARLRQALRFLLGRDDWSMLETVVEMERVAGLRSQFNFYADARPKTLTRWLFDPGYDIGENRLTASIRTLVSSGWNVGLHQSYDAWRSADLIREQKGLLQLAAGVPVTSARQHWLRFSWRDTWAAESAAGLSQDMTLMFNDRPGLRCSTALCWRPWDPLAGCAHSLSVMPTMLMDSHVYDYQPMSSSERRAAFQYWTSEVVAVGGQVAVLWHPHTLTRDYGWKAGFQELLSALPARTAWGGL